MVLGVPLRQYALTAFCSFGSMALGSACMHAYMKPELNINASDFEEEAAARRRAIEDVQRRALDDRFAKGAAAQSWKQPAAE
mmetsp:Transcript_42698/g.121764  ORF Transcript_42698/g.121764 Transcript_42698/m.121764 type:complete len:82 (+) Transcript_42698:1-246(+)